MRIQKDKIIYKWQQNADLENQNQNWPKMGVYRQNRIKMRKKANIINENTKMDK